MTHPCAAVKAAAGAATLDRSPLAFAVTLPHGKLSFPVTASVPFTIYLNASSDGGGGVLRPSFLPDAPGGTLPATLLLNGFNIEGRWYGTLGRMLAKRGIPMAVADYYRRPVSESQQLPPPPSSCRRQRRNDYVFSSARLINTLMQSDASGASGTDELGLAALDAFRRRAYSNGLVLIGHSDGGFRVVQILHGFCDKATDPRCPGCADSATDLQGFADSRSCEGYEPVTMLLQAPAPALAAESAASEQQQRVVNIIKGNWDCGWTGGKYRTLFSV